ncbi:acetoin utilization protein [Lysobacter arseniciresistens ZS79]|uniref:Acetoin utilization protein n=1 Tax=Lysobacter arseniciresistens ZS79 TaxID=913325 RepID=A0A0A0F5J4_9GAMM|nr:histone deacetylase family protein [Lysobacter arseniciresistens]KGM56657.1 acetoin utilization protein [Lysobacter arseniciresistens ZS79]
MTGLALYSHPACREHLAGTSHVEHPGRLDAVIDAVSTAFPAHPWNPAPRATRAQLLRVHDDALLARVLDTTPDPGSGPLALDADTFLDHGSAEAALRAAGAGIAAVDALLAGEARRAFCAVRPPGHHATGSTAMGFCLFNNIAIAAAHACDRHRLQRVAIVDFDVHHGNGTGAIFHGDPRVMYLSTHQQGLYPGTGASDERGVGNIANRPLPAGTGSDGFRAAWREHLLPVLDTFRPQLLLVSAGFDADARDPLANLRLVPDDFGWLTAKLVAIADRHGGGRALSMLEGGYDLDALRDGSVAHVRALAATDTTDA